MNISYCEQRSQEWWQLKKGKVSGTRFGQLISSRKNRLIYDLLNERLSDFIYPDDFISDEMQFGIDHEDEALELYSKTTGIPLIKLGLIQSDTCPIHSASPDAMNIDMGLVVEVKCTENGAIHLQRFFDGPESSYMGQIINYFAVSPEVTRVDWVSYCPYRQERPLVIHTFTRSEFESDIKKGLTELNKVQILLDEMAEKFVF